jgi:hypothetical protein
LNVLKAQVSLMTIMKYLGIVPSSKTLDLST